MRAEIISIGTELLLGQITDTNASYLAARLPALGVQVFHVSQVGDNFDRVVALIQQARDRSDLVIMTGGLGPTQDDLTREAISAVMDEPMVIDAEQEERLRGFFSRRGITMPSSNVKQATHIASSDILPNPVGTAPGWWVERDGKILVTMPGVPAEMYRMWNSEVVPRLRDKTRGEVLLTRIFKVLGMGESMVEQQLLDLIPSHNPTVATYAKPDGVHVRMSALGPSEATAAALLTPFVERVRSRLGEHIYAQDDETLATYLGRLMTERNLSVASAEALGTGALVAQLLQAAGDSQAIFRGGLVLPWSTKHATAEAVAALATSARATYAAEIGLAVGGVISDDHRVTDLIVAVDLAGTVRTSTHTASLALRDAGGRGALQVFILLKDVMSTENARTN